MARKPSKSGKFAQHDAITQQRKALLADTETNAGSRISKVMAKEFTKT